MCVRVFDSPPRCACICSSPKGTHTHTNWTPHALLIGNVPAWDLDWKKRMVGHVNKRIYSSIKRWNIRRMWTLSSYTIIVFVTMCLCRCFFVTVLLVRFHIVNWFRHFCILVFVCVRVSNVFESTSRMSKIKYKLPVTSHHLPKTKQSENHLQNFRNLSKPENTTIIEIGHYEYDSNHLCFLFLFVIVPCLFCIRHLRETFHKISTTNTTNVTYLPTESIHMNMTTTIFRIIEIIENEQYG